MSLKKLIKQNASTVMGIDSSPSSIAFTVFDGEPIQWGKLDFNGATIYDKVVDCRNKISFIKDNTSPDYICIESAIMVKSQAVAINMAMIVGSIISVLADNSQKIITIPPSAWQSHIGNKNLTKQEKLDIKEKTPGRSESWYRNQARIIRKQRTIDFFNKKYNINIDDNDVADSMGIAFYAYEKLTRHV